MERKETMKTYTITEQQMERLEAWVETLQLIADDASHLAVARLLNEIKTKGDSTND